MRATVETGRQRFLRGYFDPRARWEKMYIEGRDLSDMLASWEMDVQQYRIDAGADLQQPTVMQIVSLTKPCVLTCES